MLACVDGISASGHDDKCESDASDEQATKQQVSHRVGWSARVISCHLLIPQMPVSERGDVFSTVLHGPSPTSPFRGVCCRSNASCCDPILAGFNLPRRGVPQQSTFVSKLETQVLATLLASAYLCTYINSGSMHSFASTTARSASRVLLTYLRRVPTLSHHLPVQCTSLAGLKTRSRCR